MRTECASSLTLVHRMITKMLTYVVKVHCNVQLLDRIEEIALNGANIEWFSDEDSD